MKKLIHTLCLFCVFFPLFCSSQNCTPTQLANPGFYSESFDSVVCVTKGQAFSKTLYFKIPSQVNGFSILYIRFDSIFNIPQGATYTFNKPLGSDYLGNENGCVTIEGIAPNQSQFERIKFYVGIKPVINIPELKGEIVEALNGISPGFGDDYAIFLDVREQGSECNLRIGGKLFLDVDQNCAFDTPDFTFPNQVILINDSIPVFSNTSGIFTFSPDKFGSYSITADTAAFKLVCGSNVRFATLNSQAPISLSNDFSFEPDTTFRDLSITFNPFGWWLFGFTGQGHIVYRNDAFVAVDAVIGMRYDSIIRFVQSSITPFALDTVNRTIEWRINNIPPRSQGSILTEFQLPMPVAPMLPIQNQLWILPDSNDITPRNNLHVTENLIVGAYDPNDKQVSPPGKDSNGKITLADSVLHYKVRFQNTGTGPAVNVVIIDTLDGSLNLSSFRPQLASHPYEAKLAGNIATFTFSNIMLPDSNTNEPESHGFVEFSIKKKTGLGYGTVIENSASIYFDFNEPIKTNTVTSTYFDFSLSIKETETLPEVLLYPNPANSVVQIVSSVVIQSVALADISGRLVSKTEESSFATVLDITQLPKGIWFVEIKTQQGVVNKKLIKQ